MSQAVPLETTTTVEPISLPETDVTNGTVKPITDPPPPQPTALPSNGSVEPSRCGDRNGSCDYCVKSKKCIYCSATKQCIDFTLRLEGCSSTKEMSYGTCRVDMRVLSIVLGSIGGVLGFALLVSCCCCCVCKKKRQGWYDSQKESWSNRHSVIRESSNARKEERQKRVEEIKKKYGIPDNSKKYNRF